MVSTVLQNLYPKSVQELRQLLLLPTPKFFCSGRTSTVVPYDVIAEKIIEIENQSKKMGRNFFHVAMVHLSELPQHMEIVKKDQEFLLEVSGPVTWQDAKSFALSQGFEILTSPTEELAFMLGGVATSATGERCFGHGTLREQVVRLEFLTSSGEVFTLDGQSELGIHPLPSGLQFGPELQHYQDAYSRYKQFKNAPFPRFLKHTDLLIGTEGQLGVITKAWFRVRQQRESSYLFLLLPRWQEDDQTHLQLFHYVQNKRHMIHACELLDDESLNVLGGDRPGRPGQDVIFLEVEQEFLETLIEDPQGITSIIDAENIFEMSAKKCREVRMGIPRATFEINSRMGVIKMGTDVQVPPEKFKDLLAFYRECTKHGIAYNLFGHFGDAHLHFNFLPTKAETERASQMLKKLYDKVYEWQGSPFAEHGVGIIKLPYMRKFYGPEQKKMFHLLKQHFDPENKLFPWGFMSYEQ